MAESAIAALFSLFHQGFANISEIPVWQKNVPSVRETRWIVFYEDRWMREHDTLIQGGHAYYGTYSDTGTHNGLLY